MSALEKNRTAGALKDFMPPSGETPASKAVIAAKIFAIAGSLYLRPFLS